MDWKNWQQYFTEENVLKLLDQYRDLGFLPGILLPMLESFIPILPLFLFVAGNAAAYGFWLGFIYSWIGVCLGSSIVFLLVRKYGQKRFLNFLNRYTSTTRMLSWMERHGFGMLFLIYCFPFTPSAIVNIVGGLSRIHKKTFFLALALGKLVMIAIVSFIGYDFLDVLKSPLKLGLIVFGIFVLWLGGKVVESRLKQSEHQA
ncbi:TVP38/TMEM64 family protein [Fictibacillus phosphorivorans]|uniref:TVP38/TMEM64 family protein n=1 Tax=Fictibacillus phosphorivorans TaxID=1221500 RepID=UPI00203C09FA|nr:TVP38/TMEM64 family protein [Fictibacillus phosphorivorans]MCM3718646.1 TVP38/TMEM64 family protein [Fictibacillus phosphorivorans]MCM3776269.1 TVP38/TMEM64 family protein [Fictibacillus phosphorivorans]